MTGAATPENRINHVAIDPSAWDAAVLSCGGHLLQSWRWGTFKKRLAGMERIAVACDGGFALAQVLFRKKAGMSIGYIPRGPVWPLGDPDSVGELWARVDEVARRRRTLAIILEPDQPLLDASLQDLASYRVRNRFQPARSVKLTSWTTSRSWIRCTRKRATTYAWLRRGVTTRVAEPLDGSIATFYQMLQDTASRNDFVVHAADYYREFLQVFADHACLTFAEVEESRSRVPSPRCSVMKASTCMARHRPRGGRTEAAFLLQHEMMRWARSRGARRYDLWGIPEYDPESSVSESGDRLAASTGNDRRGLYEFKTRFGGQIVHYPPPLERVYHPFLATLARNLYSPGNVG